MGFLMLESMELIWLIFIHPQQQITVAHYKKSEVENPRHAVGKPIDELVLVFVQV